ncbi:MAG: flagellin [Candidatus Gastranaerophilales bacterium]|nr:flagellin [Candidatus Gastranaerophilales bacterium]
MSIVVNTNISALAIQNNLSEATGALALHMQRLSSGVRINSASDDAAGLALSKKLQSQISGSTVAKNNAQTGVNMLQVAETDLAEIADKVQRMRDLAVQSANGIYSATERASLNTEYQNLRTEIDRIAGSSSFSEIKLLNGTATSVVLQVGTNNSADDRVDITSYFSNSTSASLGLTAGDINSQTNAQNAIAIIDTVANTISTRRSNMGSMVNRLQGTITRVDARQAELSNANSTILDADIASESAAFTRSQILQQTSASLLQQANQMPSIALKLVQ